jgi:16S rRNA (guanine527-N7)-methyltransferase
MSAEAFRREFGVSRETTRRLTVYVDLLSRWTRRINLISPSTLPDIWSRHIADSAQIWSLRPHDARTWIDLGAGGGLPGLVVGAMAHDAGESLDLTLVESDQRKAVFLRTAAREMGLVLTVLTIRIEALTGRYDVISARALAPLNRLLTYAAPLAGPGATCLFHKGASAESELTEARRDWHIEARQTPSRVDPRSQIIEIQEFSRVRTAEA